MIFIEIFYSVLIYVFKFLVIIVKISLVLKINVIDMIMKFRYRDYLNRIT